MKKIMTFLVIIVFLSSDGAIQSASAVQKGPTLEYHLYMEEADHPRVEIKVSGLQGNSMEFSFVSGGILGSKDDLTEIFTDVSASGSSGNIPWKWKNKNSISIENAKEKSFVIKYNIDAQKIARTDNFGDMNKVHAGEQFVLFSNKAVFFSPTDILIMPDTEPEELTFIPHLPKNIELHSSVQNINGTFKAEKDLWGSLVYDFSKAYFFGGEVLFSEKFKGVSGNTYEYVLFNWRNQNDFYDSWFPSYSSPQIAAQKYMQVTDMFLKYYSENVAPLPAHHILICDGFPSGYGFPSVATRGNWYNFIQLWPENAMLYQIAHHTFHSYSFMGWASKLSVHFPDGYLHEGLPTYYEHFVPSILLKDDSTMGRLYGLLMLDLRGQQFGISDNEFHRRYNISALKVYLLDEAIKKATGNSKNINDFSKGLYDLAEKLNAPQHINEKQIEGVFSDVAGPENISLYRKISNMTEFNSKDFSKLFKPFLKYNEEMSNEYFEGNQLLFLCYMDICAAKGDQWPHYGLTEQNISYMRGDGLKGFKKYLQGLKKTEFSNEDIINVMSSVTGKDHSGFFEYWDSMGIELDPKTIPKLSTWFPEKEAGYDAKYIPSMRLLAGEDKLKETSDQNIQVENLNRQISSEPIPSGNNTEHDKPQNKTTVLLMFFAFIAGVIIISAVILSLKKRNKQAK
jgi:hypothetical protein